MLCSRFFLFLATFFSLALNNPIEQLKVPHKFKISLWAKVPGARSMTLASDGTLFVGTNALSGFSRVYRIRDWDKDGVISQDEVEIFIDNLDNPNGVAFRKGKLFVAETERIISFSDVLYVPRNQQVSKQSLTDLNYRFPSEKNHGWKFIRFAPPPQDHWLYVPVGAPCNICKPDPKIYAAIHRINVVKPGRELVAMGVRNTVGFDFHPLTKNLWFTDNGRDYLGDDLPPDELNEETDRHQHFGYPYCHGTNIVDPDVKFDSVIKNCHATKSPRFELGAHVAALGLRFYKGSQFPKKFQNQIVVAEHGSWNRSKKAGYRVVVIDTDKKNKDHYEPLVTGWLDDSTQIAWGRPVDIEEMSDGSLLISDDGIRGSGNDGSIYRLQYIP